MTDQDPSRIAIHEAGHAVCAARLGVAFRIVSVRPTPDDAGRITLRGGPPLTTDAEAAVIAAGAVAEELHFGRSSSSMGESDVENLRALSRRRYATEAAQWRLRQQARERAERVLLTSWPAVLRVASSLERLQVLTAAEVAAATREA